jgi:hypothetical protein
LPEANGGTNQSTYTTGNLLYASATNTLSKLAPPTFAGQVLQAASGLPAWGLVYPATVALGTLIVGASTTVYSTLAHPGSAGKVLVSSASGVLVAWSSATLPTTAAQGDILYGSATNVWSSLAKDANATRYLSNTGTSNNPAWAQVNLANGVTGDLPFANLTPATAISVLLGRGSAAGAGDFQEITLGSGLTMTNQVLSASGSGDVTAASNLTDNAIVRGDGGAKGVQTSGVLIDDSDVVSGMVGLSIARGTLTDPASILALTATWNDAADTFTGVDLQITNTASARGSYLFRSRIGTDDMVSIVKDTSAGVGVLRIGNSGATSTLNIGKHSYADFWLENNSGGIRFMALDILDGAFTDGAAIQFFGNASPFPGQFYFDAGNVAGAAIIMRSGGGNERARVDHAGHFILTELGVDPSTSVLSSLGQMAVYMKNNKFVIGYNNGGTITYISIPMDGSTTTWTHSTTAP